MAMENAFITSSDIVNTVKHVINNTSKNCVKSNLVKPRNALKDIHEFANITTNTDDVSLGVFVPSHTESQATALKMRIKLLKWRGKFPTWRRPSQRMKTE